MVNRLSTAKLITTDDPVMIVQADDRMGLLRAILKVRKAAAEHPMDYFDCTESAKADPAIEVVERAAGFDLAKCPAHLSKCKFIVRLNENDPDSDMLVTYVIWVRPDCKCCQLTIENVSTEDTLAGGDSYKALRNLISLFTDNDSSKLKNMVVPKVRMDGRIDYLRLVSDDEIEAERTQKVD